MKEITILSGKGGTGKTSITAALASIAKNAIYCDNDVDAANLHLIFQPEIYEKNRFSSGLKATIDANKCSKCGLCIELCRFDAISINGAGEFKINPFQCEGCRLCERICPQNAISTQRNDNNFWYVSSTRFGTLIYAKMAPGEENSGKLVTQVRKKAKEIANETGINYIINDGPPGIGCAAIASLAGTNIAVIVTEPTKTGLHDLQRLVELIQSFNIPAYVIINKFDINPDITLSIRDYLKKQDIPLIAKIPFNKLMVEAMIEGKNIIEFSPDSRISELVREIWHKVETA
jgi:MinD superfamily P-loop ATPase